MQFSQQLVDDKLVCKAKVTAFTIQLIYLLRDELLADIVACAYSIAHLFEEHV